MELIVNGGLFIKRFKGKESDWKEFIALTPEMQNEYLKTYIEHSEWNHQQIMTKLVLMYSRLYLY